jgi:hypothetical protein
VSDNVQKRFETDIYINVCVFILAYKSVYLCVNTDSGTQQHICSYDSSTQLSVQLYSYWFWCTTLFRLLFLLILVHSLVYSHIHNDSDAQHYLGSYSYYFWHTTLYVPTFIDLYTQLCIHLYSYWFRYTSLCALVLILILLF